MGGKVELVVGVNGTAIRDGLSVEVKVLIGKEGAVFAKSHGLTGALEGEVFTFTGSKKGTIDLSATGGGENNIPAGAGSEGVAFSFEALGVEIE